MVVARLEPLRTRVACALLVVVALGALPGCSGCNKNPADDQPKATVGEVLEDPTTAPTPSAPPSAASVTIDAGAPAQGDAATSTPDAGSDAGASDAVTEEIALSQFNTTVGFTGAKVGGAHDGSFKKMTGKLTLNPNAIEESKLTLDIETASVVTDTARLTEHLVSNDFFDVAKFPRASFKSTSIKPAKAEGSYTITGVLDFHGVRRSVSFPAKITVTSEKVTGNAQFSMNRKDFKVAFDGEADYLIKDYVAVRLAINAPRKK